MCGGSLYVECKEESCNSVPSGEEELVISTFMWTYIHT